ncbi:hypothetical protein [Streptomyces sp. NBC_01092]|uniref:hypothetical protein n=1 Tax=Streptomyces sp. NBC_01092 TaxID=2903748 RepID=UPI003863D79C|nr:hypothetical protein OG254_24215 [Streptomyces sp. NBC_01092]
MATKHALPSRQKGQDWLLSCTSEPTEVHRLWSAEELAPFRSGAHWRVAEAPLLPSVHAMKRIGSQRLGPVLADVEADRAWWLLPPTLGDELDDVRQLTVRRPGWVLRCPPVLYYVGGRGWLERPDGSGHLTNPVLLGAAFGPGGRLSEAAG